MWHYIEIPKPEYMHLLISNFCQVNIEWDNRGLTKANLIGQQYIFYWFNKKKKKN